SLALVAVVVKCTLGHGIQRPVRLAVQSAQRCITALVGDVRFHDTVVGVLVHGDDDLSGSPVAVGAALNPRVVLGHDVFLSAGVVDTSIHTVAGIVKRAAAGREPGCLPVRLWCSCGSAGQAPDHEFLTVVEVLGYWELDRGAMASAGDRLCAGHDRDEPTASTGALVLGDDSLEGEGGGGGVGHDVFLSVVVDVTSVYHAGRCCQACRSGT